MLMKSFKKKLITQEGFLKNILTLMTGTTIAQVLPILASPLLTRIYTPADFGGFGLFMSILSIFSVVACWRYELAIALPEKDRDALNILCLSIMIGCINCLLLSAFIPLFPYAGKWIGLSNEVVQVLWLLPVSIFLVGLYQALNQFAIRKKLFRRMAASQMGRSITIVGGQVGMGLFVSIGSASLIVGQILGQFVSALLLFRTIRKKEKKSIRTSIKWDLIKQQLVRYKKFPIFSTWSSLMNTSSVHLPLLLLAVFFSPAAVGMYTLANRVLMTPVSIIGTAISQVFLQKATEENRHQRLGDFSLIVFKKLLAFGLVPLTLLTIVAPELFTVIFGSEWEKAGMYVQFLSIWVLFVFISSPLSSIFNILELQKENLLFNAVLFVSRLAVLLIGGFIGSDMLTIALFGITGAILWLYHVIWLLRLAGVCPKITIFALLAEIRIGLPSFLAMVTCKYFIQNDFFLIVLFLILLVVFGLYRLKDLVIDTRNKRGVTA